MSVIGKTAKPIRRVAAPVTGRPIAEPVRVDPVRVDRPLKPEVAYGKTLNTGTGTPNLDAKTSAELDRQEAQKREVLRQNLKPTVPASENLADADRLRREADLAHGRSSVNRTGETIDPAGSPGTGLTTHEPAAVAAGFMSKEDYRDERTEAFRIDGGGTRITGDEQHSSPHSGEVGPKPGDPVKPGDPIRRP